MLKTSLLYKLSLSGLFLLLLPSIGSGQSTIFFEDFDGYSNGTTSDAGRWYSTPSGSENYFEVQSGRFEGDDLDGASTWETDTFDISSCDSVSFSLDAIDADDLESSDHFDVYYSTDGGSSYSRIPNWKNLGDANHTLVGDKPDDLDWGRTNSSTGGSETISKNGITGTSLILRVVMNNNAEIMALDSVSIEGYSCVSCSHSISSFSPTKGCPDTGTVTVTINGSGFTGGTGTSDVQFDGTASPNFTVISDSEIEAEVPANASDGPITVVTDACSVTSSTDFELDCSDCHQLFVNEFSNGESGLREYVELIVGNDCGGCYVDLRGWIIDDNNGDFSGGASTGEGIAQGHLRFDPNADWDSIPSGSIIVIYNASDKNLTIDNLPLNDDPMDANGDSVYVIPSDDPRLQECSSIPNSSDGSYAPCSYSSSSTWSAIAMSNSQDAMQARRPDGSYFHGASYGSDAAFDGGPDGLHVHNSGGSDDVFYFGGSDPRSLGNWSQGTATNSLSSTDETPGSSNGPANASYIDDLACKTSGCTVSAKFTVNDSLQCASSNEFDFTNTGSSSGFDHSWRFGDGQSASVENPTHSYSDSGSYELRLITDSASSCADTAYKTVLVGTASANFHSPDTLSCSRREDTLDASSSLAWPGVRSYSWSSSSGNIVQGSNTADPVIDDAGTYELVLGEDSIGCKDTATLTVGIDTTAPTVDIAPVDTFFCRTDSVTIDATASTSSSGKRDFVWKALQGEILSGDSSAFLRVASPGSFELSLTDPANGCRSVDTVEVPEDPDLPNASFRPQPSEGEAPLKVDFQDRSSNSDSYVWDLGDGDSAFVPSPSHTYEEKGRYTVHLKVKNERGCVDSTTYRFIVVEEPFEWEVPNVFSPNGDGKNDVFRVDAQGVDSFRGRIYNRWGQKLYRWEKVNSGWDGTTFEGKQVPEGTYFFDLRVIDKEGKEHTRRGELTLLR